MRFDSGLEPGTVVEPSSAAAEALSSLSMRFVRARGQQGVTPMDAAVRVSTLSPRRVFGSGATGSAAGVSASSPVLRESEVERFERREGRLAPMLSAAALRATRTRATVTLPVVASEPFTLHDEGTKMSLSVTLAGALAKPAEVAKGNVVYRGAYGRGDVVHHATAEGTEDFVVFEEAPEKPVVRYATVLGAGVAGLRLVSNTLEFIDAGGAPRLRVAPPYLVGADGQQHDARLAVEGCAVDADPAPPYQRRVTAPGARECTVVVSWDGAAVEYPAMLDPAWTATGSLATARYSHTSTLLGSGKVLAAAGAGNAGPVASAELYDPATGTWSGTGGLATARSAHTSMVLGSGKVLTLGGAGNAAYLASAELYDPATGTWSATGSLTAARYFHTSTLLGSGKVLAAGGYNAGRLATAEVYDPATGTWSATGSLVAARSNDTSTLLGSGKVLAAGGIGSASILCSAELYDPACAQNEHVASHACAACSAGSTRAAGDDPTGVDTSCAITLCAANQHVAANTCVACAPVSTRAPGDPATGADTSCANTICTVNQHVAANACAACAAGSTRAAGDDATGANTSCATMLCAANQYVAANACVACAPGSTRAAGDPATGANTNCATTLCSANQYVAANTCVACAPGSTRAAGDPATGADTTCTAMACAVDQYVSSHACVACAAGGTRPAGDLATGANTACANTVCGANEYVASHACTACALGSTRAAGDVAALDAFDHLVAR